MAGRLAPFIELGVGFNAELSARENVILNGVMMGLTPRETRNRLDAVIEFAELEDFVDLKLKNYSSGMLVRLAFSLMLEVDADILLIDEVLAVGDASFQQKCADSFHEMKTAGKTIVLVTHEMEAVESYCHRAMLIKDGEVDHVGEPDEVGRRYLRLNFESSGTGSERSESTSEGTEIRLLEAVAEGEDGQPTESFEHPDPIHIEFELEALVDTPGFDLGFIVANADGVPVGQFGAAVGDDSSRRMRAGQRATVKIRLANPFAPGRHFVHLGVNRAADGSVALYVEKALEFVVFGGPHTRGVIYLPHEVDAVIGGTSS